MKKTFAILTALLPVIYAVGLQISAASGAEDGALFTLLGMILLFGFLFGLLFLVPKRIKSSLPPAICGSMVEICCFWPVRSLCGSFAFMKIRLRR